MRYRINPPILLVDFFLFFFFPCSLSAQEQLYFDCNVDTYYSELFDISSSPTSWPKESITALLRETHRNVLPYTSSSRSDVWDALIDLDPGRSSTTSSSSTSSSSSSSSTVHLIYAQEDVPAYPHGTSSTWNREHLWPKSHGVGFSGPDLTDVHHIRPSDTIVNSARGNKFYGTCGLVRDMAECVTPAHPEADSTTSTDTAIWTPPVNVRGDIARAIMYMDLRYDGTEPYTDNLVLTDCPTYGSAADDDIDDDEMGYLSKLLEWHVQDPVDDRERQRNERVCSYWQGNRNILIDYPEIVPFLFGIPQTPLPDHQGYENCQPHMDLPNPNPVPPNNDEDEDGGNDPPDTNNKCSTLSPGDVAIIGLQSDNPDEVIFVAFESLPPGLELYMTDKAWMGTSFRDNEGIQKFTVPSDGIPKGTIFGYYGDKTDESKINEMPYGKYWSTHQGNFALSTLGDTIIVYCKMNNNDDDEEEEEDETTYNFLYGINFSGSDTDNDNNDNSNEQSSACSFSSWLDSGLTSSEYGTSDSALPPGLDGGTTTTSTTTGTTVPANVGFVTHDDNYQYVGPRSTGATKETFLILLHGGTAGTAGGGTATGSGDDIESSNGITCGCSYWEQSSIRFDDFASSSTTTTTTTRTATTISSILEPFQVISVQSSSSSSSSSQPNIDIGNENNDGDGTMADTYYYDPNGKNENNNNNNNNILLDNGCDGTLPTTTTPKSSSSYSYSSTTTMMMMIIMMAIIIMSLYTIL